MALDSASTHLNNRHVGRFGKERDEPTCSSRCNALITRSEPRKAIALQILHWRMEGCPSLALTGVCRLKQRQKQASEIASLCRKARSLARWPFQMHAAEASVGCMRLGPRDCRLNPGWPNRVQSSAGGSSTVELTCSDHGHTISGDGEGERNIMPNGLYRGCIVTKTTHVELLVLICNDLQHSGVKTSC